MRVGVAQPKLSSTSGSGSDSGSDKGKKLALGLGLGLGLGVPLLAAMIVGVVLLVKRTNSVHP